MNIKDLAFEFFTIIIIGLFIGYLIAMNTKNNIWIVVFFLIGVFCAFGRFFRLIKEFEGDCIENRREKKERR
ncbi:hypothetical protein Metvu_0901 [Methanocaldococcus vulcanius M7]|uniref:Uncharacterized protein n=1 Tax=Methanocaldococcus vulcanius (strain ATCC 700851 / DSM 12094 / M7) TaxID=579137 RepID=C9RGQ7_METVM|nr:AtpZ/AtpI family protein [Methanocaldococcus vulcanius]ACX72759.1 hypothetical protein Metvu_0901 [Methanocaldococcus vulcanius M7]